MNRYLLLPLAVVAAAVAAQTTGCGTPSVELGTVNGTVLIDGELVDSGTVTFSPVVEGPTASGRVRSDGSYALQVGQGDINNPDASRVPAGEYIVTVVVNAPSTETLGEGGPPLPGPRITAEKYASADTSDLKRTVEPGANVFAFELQRAEPAATEDQAPDGESPDGEGADEQPGEPEAAAGETEAGPEASSPEADPTEADATEAKEAEGNS
ncbi:MAG: hypothetical protein AAGJ46_06145 [Planctomycetota bacterium]